MWVENLRYKKIVIGIDQSYKNTGISIAADGKLLKVKSLRLEYYKNNTEKREAIEDRLNKIYNNVINRADCVECIIERVRLQSRGFLNIDYIKSIGALNAVIVDCSRAYGVSVFSVDTRCWKSQVIGTSKPKKNKYNVPPEKWPTIEWVIKQGREKDILVEVKGRKEKGVFFKNGVKYEYNNDAADSAGIAIFGFVGDKNKLKLEY